MSHTPNVALITGAAGGLGDTVCKVFAAHGYRLVLTGQNADKLEGLRNRLGLDKSRCLTGAADITNRVEIEALCSSAVSLFGGIDTVLHLVGGFRMSKVHETSDADWNFLFDVNVRSFSTLASVVVPILLRQGRGNIVTVASRAALAGAAEVGAYSAAKAAVVRLTESLAAETLHSGIRVNCILPSTIDTPTNRQQMPGADPDKWVKPDSLAEVLLFLSSPAARDISGACIPVYGRV